MKNVLKIFAVLISCTAVSCTDKVPNKVIETTVIDKTALDRATELIVDSTDNRFDSLADAHIMLVYKDNMLIVNNKNPRYGAPLLSLYDLNDNLRHLIDYIPHGSDIDEMVACLISITGDELFVNDSFYSGRYCTIALKKPLLSPNKLHLLNSGIEEHGVAAIPFRKGLLVENPQCYTNEEAGIVNGRSSESHPSLHEDGRVVTDEDKVNDVPRLLYYEQGRCITPQGHIDFQVADVNTGADIHFSELHHRVCFVSHRQPFVEFYDDSLRLIHRLSLPSEGAQKIHIGTPQTTMRQTHNRREKDAKVSAKFNQTQRVVGAGSQLHAFLCSAADDKHIYLVYCGKLFSYDYHTYPTYILVLDWNGKLVNTYRYNRWIQAISPSTEQGTFYMTIYADDDCSSAQMKLVKVTPQRSEETD